ncbi:hypothetical protein KBD33_04115 [Candidatus Gracilibacteria bacterium]|nr:hypothetical protein [Candidatus Gracilibacteria bacterium]
MDIKKLNSSGIYPTQNGLSLVQFPSFSGSVEVAIYKHNNATLGSNINGLFPYFRCDLNTLNISKIILASEFMDIIGVRIIDAINIYEEEIIFMKEGEIVSFMIKGKAFIAIIYTDLENNRLIYTNFSDPSGIFEWILDDTMFIVRNSLTEVDIFTWELKIVSTRSIKSPIEIIRKYSLTIISDPLFPESFRSLQRLFEIPDIEKYISIVQSGNIFNLTFNNIEKEDIQKFVGFLGKYVCIITDNSISFPGFLTEKTARDSKFYIPSEFEPNTEIDRMDPRWHELRMGLLEFSYGIYLLKEHQRLLEGGINELDNLNNKRIEFQKIHMNMTLNDMENILPIYLEKYNLLIQLLQYKIS